MKETTINFNKWLFENKLVPNSSFLWFNYTESRETVIFFQLEELYDIFISKGKISDLINKKQKETETFYNKYLNKE